MASGEADNAGSLFSWLRCLLVSRHLFLASGTDTALCCVPLGESPGQVTAIPGLGLDCSSGCLAALGEGKAVAMLYWHGWIWHFRLQCHAKGSVQGELCSFPVFPQLREGCSKEELLLGSVLCSGLGAVGCGLCALQGNLPGSAAGGLWDVHPQPSVFVPLLRSL